MLSAKPGMALRDKEFADIVRDQPVVFQPRMQPVVPPALGWPWILL